jgi:hypothetical protein
MYIICAHQALHVWLPGALPAEDKPRLRAVFGAVRAALALDADFPWMTPERLALRTALISLLGVVLDVSGIRLGTDVSFRRVHAQLHAAGALSQTEQAALCTLMLRICSASATLGIPASGPSYAAASDELRAERQRNATADAARHGLRACALPECGKTEAHAKEFKMCGRCRGVVYCSPAHQTADWRRHKREDGCKAAA